MHELIRMAQDEVLKIRSITNIEEGWNDYCVQIIDSVVDELVEWQGNQGVYELLNPSNWNLEKLYDEYGHRRKPKAYFFLYLTSKNNLVLEWSPVDHLCVSIPDPIDHDWLRFSGGKSMYSEPDNRIFRVNHIDGILRNESTTWRKEDATHFNWCIVHLISKLLQNVYSFLGSFVECIRVTDLYYEYESLNLPKAKLTSASIKNVAEVEAEREKIKKMTWAAQTFGKNGTLGISITDFLKVYKDTGKYAPTGRVCTPVISGSRVKKLLIKLENDFPEAWKNFFPPKPAEIIQLHQKEK